MQAIKDSHAYLNNGYKTMNGKLYKIDKQTKTAGEL